MISFVSLYLNKYQHGTGTRLPSTPQVERLDRGSRSEVLPLFLSVSLRKHLHDGQLDFGGQLNREMEKALTSAKLESLQRHESVAIAPGFKKILKLDGIWERLVARNGRFETCSKIALSVLTMDPQMGPILSCKHKYNLHAKHVALDDLFEGNRVDPSEMLSMKSGR